MKYKYKPKKQGKNLPFINYTKKYCNSYNRTERGITLIALIVSIIILILLAAVSLRAITGEESIIKVSSDATEDYNILQYKEQIEQLRDNAILKYEMTGQNLTLQKLAKEMEQETIWVKRATANINKDENNEDIVVVTTDGYIFEVYYDENYGQKYVEYLGREDGGNIPTIVARYNKETNKITAVAKEDTEGIRKIEIIHKGEVVNTPVEGGKASIEYAPSKTGWYIIKASSNNGKVRYAWIRVSSTMVAPEIKIASSGEQENGWYGKDNVAVVVRITAKGTGVKEVHYTTNRWETEEVVAGSTATLERNNKIRNNKHIWICSG